MRNRSGFEEQAGGYGQCNESETYEMRTFHAASHTLQAKSNSAFAEKETGPHIWSE
jgi:hypothetical protein